MNVSIDGLRTNATRSMNRLYDAIKYVMDVSDIHDIEKKELIEKFNEAAMFVDTFNCVYDDNIPDKSEDIARIQAEDISDCLEEGLKLLKQEPDKYKKFDSENGWGTYEHFVPFVESYLEACKQYPNAIIEVSR